MNWYDLIFDKEIRLTIKFVVSIMAATAFLLIAVFKFHQGNILDGIKYLICSLVCATAVVLILIKTN